MENYSYIGEVHVAKVSEYFKYNITYPVLKLYKKCAHHECFKQEIIDKINYTIYKDVMDFKNDVRKQSLEYKKLYENELSKQADKPLKYQYEVYVTYEVPYDKNNIISIVLTKYEFTGGAHGMTFVNAYNYNLLNGEILKLRDMFKDGVDYIELINDFIYSEISKEPEKYFSGKDGFKGISKDQPFYIDEEGIIIYFGLYEIAPYYVGIPKFKLKFSEFKDYLTEKNKF